jgi:hypothetical protein
VKRIWAVIVGIGLALPLMAAAGSCTSQDMTLTMLRAFVNPECLINAGILPS